MRALPAALGAAAFVLAIVAVPAASATATATGVPEGAPAEAAGIPETGRAVDASETERATSSSELDGNMTSPAFDRDRYVEHRGDVLEMAVRIPANDTGRLALQGPGGNATVTVHDDGDGRIEVQFNTFSSEWSVAGADEVSAVEGATAHPPDGDYRLALRSNGSTDEATLALEPRSLERIGTWQAPRDETTIEEVTDLRAGIDDGTFGRATAVNESHLLVAGIEITGLEGALAKARGENVTTRFRNAVDRHGHLEVVQHPDTVGTMVDPAVVHVLDGPGVRVLADARNDSYFVLVDPAEVRLTQGDREVDPERVAPYDADGMWLQVRAGIASESPLADEDERAAAVVAPRSASLSTAPDGAVHVASGTTRTISGATNVGTGWNVTVVVTGEDDPATDADESFRLTRKGAVEIPDEGSYRYAGGFDVSVGVPGVPPGTSATVDVRFENRSLLEEPVPLVVEQRRASVAATGVGRDGEFTTVEVTASLSTGGFVVLHGESRDGPVVGHSDYLDAGDHTVEVYVGEPTDPEAVVAVTYRDDDHDEWFDGPGLEEPYSEGEPADVIVLETPHPTASPTPATPVTPTPTPATPVTPTDTPQEPFGDATTPGFGVTVAVVALFVALAARRRR